MKTLTLAEVKKMTKDKSLVSLATSVFKAMAYENIVRKIVEPKQKEVINFFKFKVDIKNLRLTDKTVIVNESELYLISDEDMKLYCKEMNSFYIQEGFKVEFEYCPLLMAEDLTRKAKAAFVDALSNYTSISFDDLMSSGLDIYNEYIELNLKFFSSKVKPVL